MSRSSAADSLLADAKSEIHDAEQVSLSSACRNAGADAAGEVWHVLDPNSNRVGPCNTDLYITVTY